MKVLLNRDYESGEITIDRDPEEVAEAEESRDNRHYVVELPGDLISRHDEAQAAWKAIQETLFAVWDTSDERRVEQHNAEYRARSSGLTRDQIVDEVKRRLIAHDDSTVKCSHCNPGYRNPLGNCVVCGHGPSPASISFLGLEEMLIHEVNAAFTN